MNETYYVLVDSKSVYNNMWWKGFDTSTDAIAEARMILSEIPDAEVLITVLLRKER